MKGCANFQMAAGPISIYIIQLKSLFLALTAGPQKTETCRSIYLSIDFKGKYGTSLLPFWTSQHSPT